MNIVKFLSRHRLIGAALVLIPLLAACGPAPLGTSWAGLRIVGEEQNILVAFNDRLVMVNPEDGKAVPLRNEDGEIRMDDQGNPRLWDIRQSANHFFSSPLLINDEKLLAASYNQVLYSIDLKTARIENGTGTPIPANTGNLVADLVGDGERVYAGLSSKNLVAINPEDFSVEWTVTTKHGVWSPPLLVEDVLYFSSLDHFIYAVDAQSGEQLWSLDVGGAVASAPAYADGKLYVGSFARKLYEISTSGEILNTYDTLDWIWGTPSVVDNILYAADLVGNVYALDTNENLREVWKVKPASMAIRPTPLVTDQYVLVASRDQKLYWLNREDGSPVMDDEGRALVREMQGPIFSDILLIQPNEQTDISEPIVVVSTLTPGQMLVAYSLAEGRFLWTYALQ